VNIFKRSKRITDERMENVRNKIYKEMYYVIAAICFISILFNMYKYGLGNQTLIEESLIEFLILIVGGLYYLARSIYLGVFWDEIEMHDRTSKTPMSKKNIYNSIGLALIIAVAMGINSALSYADSSTQGVWYFVSVLFVSILIYLPLFLVLFVGVYYIAKKISLRNKEE
jgi:hypothetical protein